MDIREPNANDAVAWSEAPDVVSAEIRTFAAPPGHEVNPADAIVLTFAGGTRSVAVPWTPDEIDVARLARGGSVWIVTLGGLPPHRVEVR